MLSRWEVAPKPSVIVKHLLTCKAFLWAPVNPGAKSKFDWPKMKEIRVGQEKSRAIRPPTLK